MQRRKKPRLWQTLGGSLTKDRKTPLLFRAGGTAVGKWTQTRKGSGSTPCRCKFRKCV